MKPDFNKSELLPCIVQDELSREVLMLGYMNQEAYDQTLASGKVTFFSRSKQRLWTKGETSGNFLNLKEMRLDCDLDTLLALVKPAGPACHLGTDTCFGDYPNRNKDLGFLVNVIESRKENPVDGSYTNRLLDDIDLASQKVGEEAVELIIEAKDNREDRFLAEAADLLYHYLVLLSTKGHKLDEVIGILKERRN